MSCRNLEELNKACCGLSYTDIMTFKAMFLGSIAVQIEPEKWDESLELIKGFFKKEPHQKDAP
jgi:hypothetical protein